MRPLLLRTRLLSAAGKHAVRALLSPAYASVKGVPPAASEDEAAALLGRILPSAFFLRVERASGTPRALTFVSEQAFAPDAHFVWLYDGPAWRTAALSGALVVAGVLGACFPLWPRAAQAPVGWASTGVLAFFVFYYAVAALRQVFFAASALVAKPGIWVLPNWHEDCSVVRAAASGLYAR